MNLIELARLYLQLGDITMAKRCAHSAMFQPPSMLNPGVHLISNTEFERIERMNDELKATIAIDEMLETK